jgi:hypothetical protein
VDEPKPKSKTHTISTPGGEVFVIETADGIEQLPRVQFHDASTKRNTLIVSHRDDRDLELHFFEEGMRTRRIPLTVVKDALRTCGMLP